MLIRQIMTANPTTVGPQDVLRTAIEKMAAVGCRRLPVMEQGKLVGIVADLDIRQALNSPIILHERWQDEDLMESAPIQACMTFAPVTVTPQTPVIEAAQLMRSRKIGGLPVLEEGRLVGIVTETDMLDALIELLGK